MPKERLLAESFIGQKFGRLEVLGVFRKKNQTQKRFICKCECGTYSIPYVFTVFNKSARSCGCFHKENSAKTIIKNATKHGMASGGVKFEEYKIWQGIKRRCYNPKDNSYKYCGAMGIRMCARWHHSFANFYKDMGPRPSPTHSIDRINNYKGYSPDNCRWATPEQQSRNKRNTIYVNFNGERIALIELCKMKNINHHAVSQRIRALGMPLELALTNKKITKRKGKWFVSEKKIKRPYFFSDEKNVNERLGSA